MGIIRDHRPVLLIAAIVSRFDDTLAWARERMAEQYGSLELESPVFEFTETDFYTRTMGEGLKKQFIAFSDRFDPGRIAETKLHSNQLEEEYALQFPRNVTRPLNIDPGYISEAKLVLVTTKDRDHRIYLHDGIFAEVTLHFRGGIWESQRWTYPDYQRADFQEFFSSCRKQLRSSFRNE